MGYAVGSCAGPQRRHQNQSQQQHGIGQVDDDHRRRQLQLDRYRPKQHLKDQEDQCKSRWVSQDRITPVLEPGDSRNGRHHDAHERRRPAVADLDHRGKVERRKPLTVAPGPVIPTAHPRTGDTYDPSEHDEPKRQCGA